MARINCACGVLVIAGCVVLGAAHLAQAAGTPGATGPATTLSAEDLDAQTPLGLLREITRTLPAGGIEKARASYHANTAAGKENAEVCAAYDLGIAKLEKVVRDTFGESAAEDVDHVCGAHCAADIEKAKAQINGDKAVVKYADGSEFPMLNVNGKWHIDADAIINTFPPEIRKPWIQLQKDTAILMDRLAKDVGDGKYKTADELQTAAVAEMLRIMPKEFKGDATQPAGTGAQLER